MEAALGFKRETLSGFLGGFFLAGVLQKRVDAAVKRKNHFCIVDVWSPHVGFSVSRLFAPPLHTNKRKFVR